MNEKVIVKKELTRALIAAELLTKEFDKIADIKDRLYAQKLLLTILENI